MRKILCGPRGGLIDGAPRTSRTLRLQLPFEETRSSSKPSQPNRGVACQPFTGRNDAACLPFTLRALTHSLK